MDRGAWQAMVYQVAKSWTRLKQLHIPESLLGWAGRHGPRVPTCTWSADGAGLPVRPCTLGSRYMQVGSSTRRDPLPS